MMKMLKISEVLLIVSLLAADTASQQCSPTEYQCDGGCAQRCDGYSECSDGADETTLLCKQTQCSAGNTLGGDLENLEIRGTAGDILSSANKKFRCDYGGCISDKFRCNGRRHCWDGSDETEALCKSTKCKRLEFKCTYGGCIRRLWRCDGKADCEDSSDESPELCGSWSCSSRKPHKCDYGACIEERKKCDGTADCVDNSDESPKLCGAAHNFTQRIYIEVPQAEKNPPTPRPPPQTPATVPPPPPTQPPTQPPPTPSPIPPSDLCQASGLCTCPGIEICVPCDRLEYCSSAVNGPKCSLPSDDLDHGITVNVLACGSQAYVNVAVFSRNHEALCSSKEVPLETVVMADCWGTASILAQCRGDGMWHPYGNQLKENSMEPTAELCQPKSINSLICGHRPRFRRPANHFVNTRPQQQWPWLASIFRNHTYHCTATVISQDYLLTAAHCITRSEESALPISPEWLIVHYIGEDGNIRSSKVTEIRLYPNYKGGQRPSKDVALLKVTNQIRFSQKTVPACVSTQGFPNLKIAAGFERKNPRFDVWDTLLLEYDSRCIGSLDRCSTLPIETDQFCAIDVGGTNYLKRGDSGGPYIVNMGNDITEKWTVAGLVSAASGKDSCKQPFTIFVKVNDFWSWIDSCAHRQVCSVL